MEEEFPTEITTTIKLLQNIKMEVSNAIRNNSFPIILSGNCSSTVGVVNGLNEENVGVLWFDAHGDCETPETTQSGFLDGMGLSMLLHSCWKNLLHSYDLPLRVAGNKIIVASARDLSTAEIQLINSNHILHIIVDGIRSSKQDVIEEACATLKQSGVIKLHIHIDVDVLDPTVAPANSHAVGDGLSREDLLETIQSFAKYLEVASLTIASYDSTFDVNSKMQSTIFAIIELISNTVIKIS